LSVIYQEGGEGERRKEGGGPEPLQVGAPMPTSGEKKRNFLSQRKRKKKKKRGEINRRELGLLKEEKGRKAARSSLLSHFARGGKREKKGECPVAPQPCDQEREKGKEGQLTSFPYFFQTDVREKEGEKERE